MLLKQKKIISLVFLNLIGTLITFAQTNEIYNKIQIEPISKSPIKDSKLSFGEIFNEAKALLYFSDFWVEGRIGLKFYSLDNWNSGKIETMDDRTHGNIGWYLSKDCELVFGTQYYKMIPGTYMNAYEDALPDGRWGKTGAAYINTKLKDIYGLSFGINIPIQDEIFTSTNYFKINGSVVYESPLNLNIGSAIYTDLYNDFSIANFISSNQGNPFTWMLGYTYNGTGIDGKTPATHYFDSTMNLKTKKFLTSTDIEIGYNDDLNTNPMYLGLLGIYYPIPEIQAKCSILYNVSNINDYSESQNTLFIYPRFIFTILNNDISIGPEFTIVDMPNSSSQLGFSFPIYWKHSL